MAHIGLTPQSVHKLGGYRVQGKTTDDAQRLIEDAKQLEEAGAFAIVLELVPREIAELIAKGMSNPDIARTLFLSRKTVERHVSGAFGKLGVKNRTQLAARMAASDEGHGP